ncbi:alpha/beta fold hydrolase [Candidatus Neptunochlamydia vexilliferae]|uniref:Non-heme chloroperoxidase n=1 Tax=Candidatus Neptunichlamydia vexilliferae TaxID=1651774 RepID=A0ABS0B0H0_9BACT|nr:alpha/beta hydrolase [Candidatus Neptunochlamydia vexilliferae]MBF5059866.1 putative non-heme chloroperoxidase [Candidatus Neptunochlamydia vexilliferae]
MPFAKINALDLYYETHGSGEPIVFISGFSTHHMTWLSCVERLKNHYQLILFDNRGAGQTTAPPPPYTIETMAEDTVALMDHLGVKTAHMVGSSMGTAIVQTIAHRYPERIDKGVLIAPFPKLPEAALLKTKTTGKLLEKGVPLELVIETVIPWLFSSDFVKNPENVAAKIEEMTNNPYLQGPEGFLGQMEALGSFDSRSFVKELKSPFLLMAGEDDLSTPLYCAEYLHSHLPNSTLHVFPRVGHMIHAEKKDEVIDLILQFVRNSSGD